MGKSSNKDTENAFDNRMIQFVISEKNEQLDPEAKKYVYAEKVYLRDDHHSIIQNRYTVSYFPYDNDGYIEAAKYIGELTERIIEAYGATLNKYHDVELSKRQWETLFPWSFATHLMDFYYKYNKLKNEKKDSLYLCGPAFDWEATVGWGESSSLNRWLYVADCIGIPCKKIVQSDTKKNGADKHTWQLFLRAMNNPMRAWRRIVKVISKKISNLFVRDIIQPIRRNTEIIIFRTNLDEASENELQRKSNGILQIAYAEDYSSESKKINLKYKKDINKREEILNATFIPKNEFECIIERFVIHHLPLCLFEAFDDFWKKSKEITFEAAKVRKIYVGGYQDELMDFCIANMSETKVVDIAHSAWYCWHPTYMIPELIWADEFITWGWKHDGFSFLDTKIKAVSIARLSKGSKKKKRGKKILLMPVAGKNTSDDMGGMNLDYYVDKEMDFIRTLDDEIRRNLVVRIEYQNIYNKRLIEKCRDYPEVRFENKQSILFNDSVRESRLVVCDYFSSPLIEALTLGIPVVMFQGESILGRNPYNDKWLNRFKINRIYTEEGADMAKILNENKRDFDRWLFSEKVQQLYREYMNEVAGWNLPKKTLAKWEEEFLA